MAKTTTNKSLRVDLPAKAMRRAPVEVDDIKRTAGATGTPAHKRKRPGRAASLRSSSNRTRSQRWRSPKKGARAQRRGVLAKGSRTASR